MRPPLRLPPGGSRRRRRLREKARSCPLQVFALTRLSPHVDGFTNKRREQPLYKRCNRSKKNRKKGAETATVIFCSSRLLLSAIADPKPNKGSKRSSLCKPELQGAVGALGQFVSFSCTLSLDSLAIKKAEKKARRPRP